jgi:exopolysaccharide production protein ExoQ
VNRAYPARLTFFCFVTIGLGISFLFAEHSLQSESSSLALEADQTLSRSRQFGIISLGLLGCLLLLARGGQPLVYDNALARVILSLGVFCLASVLWSEDVSFTIRRLGSAVCCFLCAIGLCRQFLPSDLCKMALIISLAYLCAGVGIELLGLGYVMGGPRYRFGGTVNPNLQATYCALIGLSAVCLHRRAIRGQWILRGMLALAVVFLILTGSRTALYSFVLAVASYWWLTTMPLAKILTLTGLSVVFAMSVLLYELFAGNATSQFMGLLSVGRDAETVSTMTGRVPIWTMLLPYVSERPLLGYGYQGFWGGDRLLEMIAVVGWAPASAHNAVLETVLSLGLIGGVLHVLAIAIGINRSSRYFLQTADAGYGFIFALLVFASVHSLAESAFSKPLFPCMIFATGLSMLAFQREPRQLRPGVPMRFAQSTPGRSNV